MYERAKLKLEVKQIIRETRPRPIWVTLLYLVILAAGATLLTYISALDGLFEAADFISDLLEDGYTIEEIFRDVLANNLELAVVLFGSAFSASAVGSLLVGLWQGLMGVGFSGYCLSLVRGEQPKVSRIFCGFPRIGKVLLTQILVMVFTALWTLLYMVGYIVVVVIAVLFAEVAPAVTVILMILAYAALLVLMVRTVLRYAMTNYILLDTGKYGLTAITESKQMMKGNKGKLFVLQLSFIGWYLLEVVIVLAAMLVIFIAVAAMGITGGFAGEPSFGMIFAMLGIMILVGLAAAVLMYLVEIWLLPYLTGSVAKFYDFIKPQPVAETTAWPTAENISAITRTITTGEPQPVEKESDGDDEPVDLE